MTKNLKEISEAVRLYDILNKKQDKVVCRFIGGCVRDQILSSEIKDIDLATSLLPDQVKDLLSKENISINDDNKNYGLITAYINKYKFEITTLRKDINQKGRQSDVLFTTDWKQDALRRDFTINSIYYDFNNYIDPFNGMSDLKNGKIRFISDPSQKIKEDYLRALRYFRFFAIYSKEDHDDYVLNSIVKHEQGILNLSKERLIQELSKILLSGKAYILFNNKFCKDFFSYVYKGIKYFERLDFGKSNKTIDISFDYVILLALLLIDTSDHYKKFIKDFNLSNKIKDRLTNIQKNYQNNIGSLIESFDELEKKLISYPKSTLKDYIQFQYLVNNDYSYEEYLKKYNNLRQFDSPVFNFDSSILISGGIKEGPNLGKAISFLKHRWISNNFSITDKDIEDAIEIYK